MAAFQIIFISFYFNGETKTFTNVCETKNIKEKIIQLDYPYFSISDLLLPMTRATIPSTISNAPTITAIRYVCDAAKYASATINIPKIKATAERAI